MKARRTPHPPKTDPWRAVSNRRRASAMKFFRKKAFCISPPVSATLSGAAAFETVPAQRAIAAASRSERCPCASRMSSAAILSPFSARRKASAAQAALSRRLSRFPPAPHFFRAGPGQSAGPALVLLRNRVPIHRPEPGSPPGCARLFFEPAVPALGRPPSLSRLSAARRAGPCAAGSRLRVRDRPAG